MNKPIESPWPHPLTVNVSGFKGKGLSDWTVNPAVGCLHACTFCYVPEVSTLKLKPVLQPMGVTDPDAQWGQYAFPRRWAPEAFRRSALKAEATEEESLSADGQRVVMYSSTTDPFQHFRDRELAGSYRAMIESSLRILLEETTLRVRILTRSPLAKELFPLMKEFGDRLCFGMSLPTLDNRYARVFEPHAPSLSHRMRTLCQARDAGIPVFVAVAPTFPLRDGQYDEFVNTLKWVAGLDPVTIFMEPINIRAKNIDRIRTHAEELGFDVPLEAFADPHRLQVSHLRAFGLFEEAAKHLGLVPRLKLWPDQSLRKPHKALQPEEFAQIDHLFTYWDKPSGWPGDPQLP